MSKRNGKRDKKRGNDAVIQLKRNQKITLTRAKKIIENTKPISIDYNSQEVKRNRQENRLTEVFLLSSELIEEGTLFEYASCLVRVYRKTAVFKTKKKGWDLREDEAFYLSTVSYEAKTMGKIIRNHWSIENSNNYIRDVVLKEDQSRIRVNPGIMSRIRSFALNILRVNKSNNFKRTIHKNAMDLNRVLNLNYLL